MLTNRRMRAMIAEVLACVPDDDEEFDSEQHTVNNGRIIAAHMAVIAEENGVDMISPARIDELMQEGAGELSDAVSDAVNRASLS